ncbi:hypothetical protein N9D59_06000 [Burkholderiaceae bacterium]|jgi:hypothetical protein|nr:hypothetical protein [Burkholderiaceae bacterium]
MKHLAIDFGTKYLAVQLTSDTEDLISQGDFISIEGNSWWGEEYAPNDTVWEFNADYPGQIKVIDEQSEEFHFNLDSEDVLTVWS